MLCAFLLAVVVWTGLSKEAAAMPAWRYW